MKTLLTLLAVVMIGCGTTEPTVPSGAKHRISGKIAMVPPNVASVGVEVTLDGVRSTVTNDSSQYHFDSVANGSHEVRPSRAGSSFTPASRNVVVADADIANVDFVQAIDRIPYDSVHLIRIPPGSFMMGCNEGDYRCGEISRPRHKVTLTRPFLIGQTEVTQAVWERVMTVNNSRVKNPGNPVTQMPYDSVITFCNRLSELHGLRPVYSGPFGATVVDRTANGYRLPTHAEWEYAAAAGSTTAVSGIPDPTPGSDLESYYKEVDKVAWYRGTFQGAPSAEPLTVGQLRPNAWGLYDVHGNAAELAEGGFIPYTSEDKVDPDFTSSNGVASIKGGSNTPVGSVGSTLVRWFQTEISRPTEYHYVGFRIVRFE